MHQTSLICLLLSMSVGLLAQQQDGIPESRITTMIDSSHSNNMVLTQVFEVDVPLDSVWNAYTTEKGWESWAVAQAEIDFKVNGIIRTNYNKELSLEDASTITLHIINYIPRRMLTLQAEITKNFPEFMQEDEKDLFNTILFEEISPTKTRVTSYGIGYKYNEKYMQLMKFFIQGNAQSYLNLISYLESGIPSVKY